MTTISRLMPEADMIRFIEQYAADNGCRLDLEGEVGFGRECVGILHGDHYPEYHWYTDYQTTREIRRLDDNGDVWTPEDAYHKGPYVAVLGRGGAALEQLYEWVKWFANNGFCVEVHEREPSSFVDAMFHGFETPRMVKQ